MKLLWKMVKYLLLGSRIQLRWIWGATKGISFHCSQQKRCCFLSNKWSQNGRTKLRSWVVTYDDCQSLLAWIGHQKAGLRLKNKTVAAPMTPMKNLLYVYVPYQHVLAVINHKLFLETHLPRLYSIVGVP